MDDGVVNEKRPLVMGVEEAFVRTDLTLESFWAGMGSAPMRTLGALWRYWRRPARLKAELAAIAPPRLDLVPVAPQLAEMAAGAIAEGREVVLASGANAALVSGLARHYGLSERVFASDAEHDLPPPERARMLTRTFGAGGFDYAGARRADLPIWQAANEAIVLGDASLARRLEAEGHPVHLLPGGWSWRALARALRPHQWVKNVLLFVPMLAAHDFSLQALLLTLLGIVSFSGAASSIYVVNDLLDLEADRLHPTKRNRPFASGAVPLRVGMAAGLGAAAVALAVGAWLGPAFFGVVVLYMALSLAYSLRLKRLRWIDIATLAALYTLRVVAGGAAIGAFATIYLMVFIYPVFLSLGAVKRMTELARATSDERLPGRGYARADRDDLLNVAWLGVALALVAFVGYSLSEQARELYPTRWLLWAAVVPIFAWLARMVRLGYQGRMDYDPIVFALRDKRGLGLLFIALAIMFYAAGLWQEWFGY